MLTCEGASWEAAALHNRMAFCRSDSRSWGTREDVGSSLDQFNQLFAQIYIHLDTGGCVFTYVHKYVHTYVTYVL